MQKIVFRLLLLFLCFASIVHFSVAGLYAQTSVLGLRIPKSIPQHVSYDRFDHFLDLEGSQPKIRISLKKNWIISTGQHKITRQNRELVNDLLAQKNIEKPFLLDIKNRLLEIKKADPLFFPVIFNLGRVLLILGEYQYAIFEFSKVTHVVSQYWLGFFYLAKSYQLAGNTDKAIQNFRLSYKKNHFELAPLVALGDLHLAHKKYTKGEQIYRHCLSVYPDYNNAMIGLGKVAFYRERYNYATLWFQKVDTRNSFNKKMYFYYAESAFFTHDYEQAVRQYQMALLNHDPRVFSSVSREWLLERKEQAGALLKVNQ